MLLVGVAAWDDLGGNIGGPGDGQRNMGRSHLRSEVAQVRPCILILAITKCGKCWYKSALSNACLEVETEKNACVFSVIAQRMEGSRWEAKSQLWANVPCFLASSIVRDQPWSAREH